MQAGGLARRAASLMETRTAAVVLCVLYPTLFALSNNWYTIGAGKILWLLGAAAVLAALLAAVGWIADTWIGSLLTRASPKAAGLWRTVLAPVLAALVCVAVLAALLWGTLEELFGSRELTAAVVLAAALAIALAFVRDRARLVNAALGLFSLLSVAGWLWSYGEIRLTGMGSAKSATALESVTFKAKPNIYLFIFDAYGNEQAYARNFAYDNGAHYRELEARKFKVVQGFSNYFATWPTTLSLFLGTHHYYRISAGVADSKLGRLIMAGLARNPVLEALRGNGYRTQYISGIDYFVNERGVLDYVFPEEPLHSALRVYSSPVITAILGEKSVVAGTRGVKEELKVLKERMPGPPSGDSPPWFTFSHIALPNHSPNGTDWLQLKGFEKTFRDRTEDANRVMLQVISSIKAKDPGAVVIILGDHGAWRYRKLWVKHEDPNAAFAAAGVAAENVTLDLFGTMIAVDTGGRCDRLIYPSLSHVNVLRVLFACLAEDESLLAGKAEDMSLFMNNRHDLWLTVRDGQPRPSWEPYARN